MRHKPVCATRRPVLQDGDLSVYGYAGQILSVNLTSNKITIIPLNREYAGKFVGGSGYASRVLYDTIDFAADPLSSGNVLMFMTGPLTGTLAPCTGRHVICARSPLTGFWGESNSGGYFGAGMKFAGFDGIMISGKAKAPVTINVDTSSVKIESAEHLWGLDTQETQDAIKNSIGKARIACIGQAGENLVRFAGIVNEERIAARCGMGAVMGSKNLKAVTVNGAIKPKLHNPEKFRELALKTSKELKERHTVLGAEGTAMYVDRGMTANDMPIKYFQESEFDVSELNAKAMESILTGRKACHSCPIACGRIVSVPELQLSDVAGPEFQTIAAFGTNMKNPKISRIAQVNRLCNIYGLDTISTGSIISLVMNMCEKGFLDWDINWGDMDAVARIIHDIALRNGKGDELAEGSLRFSKPHNADEEVLHVKGMEIPNHDPRAYSGLATIYAVSARGASHTEGDMHTIDIGIDVPCLGIHASDRVVSVGKGETAAKCQDFRAFHDSMILCHFPDVTPAKMVELLNVATGSKYIPDDILRIGSNAVTMKRLFNLRCGLTAEDDVLPHQLLEPLPESMTEDWVPDLNLQLDDYYSYRGWDRRTGWPGPDEIDALLK
ncbi:MAG: aldehyde ferredoxin oxidoreductase family protein [Candidatus Thorarchaeota archaeon]|nr:aldehyde ferredoxin oxidoreductase family protein [Candidatus Thorarchaeota archaeon]